MNARKSTTAVALGFAFAIGTAWTGIAQAQTGQDHAAHHPDAAPAQTAPGAPMQPGATMPGMQGMMGGDMQQMMRMMEAMREHMAERAMGGPMGRM